MRFLPHSDADRAAMLEAIGVTSLRDLFIDIPEAYHLRPGSLNLPPARSEAEILQWFSKAAEKNQHTSRSRFFLGGGTYHHFIPAAVDYVISRGEFLTAYTPYQPEIAQGTLQTLFEFQTMIARLTGMDISNASMYDAATSVAEAALMARRITRKSRVVVAASVNPRYRAVTGNYLSRLDGEYREIAMDHFGTNLQKVIHAIDEQTACVIVQYPDFYGSVYDLAPLRQACDDHHCLMVVAFSDPTAFALINPPGSYGADIAVGSGQSLGIPMGFGGPHLGLFTCKKQYVRQMPGRLCGMTSDRCGRRGFVLTLSTREQHIRREKATSNICSNQGLMCTAAAVYLSLMGNQGLCDLATRSVKALTQLVAGLPEQVTAASGAHYSETVISFGDRRRRDRFLQQAEQHHIFAGIPLEQIEKGREPRHLLTATTEMIGEQDIADFLQVLELSR